MAKVGASCFGGVAGMSHPRSDLSNKEVHPGEELREIFQAERTASAKA